MSLEKRQKCKNDVKVVIAQIHSSMVGRDSLTSQKCFELLDFLAKDHVDQFVGEFHLLLPQIEVSIIAAVRHFFMRTNHFHPRNSSLMELKEPKMLL